MVAGMIDQADYLTDTKPLNRPVLLYGPPGSGKSATGRVLADQLGYQFSDLDVEIEARQGMSIPDIFSQLGEPAFRKMEREYLADLLERDRQVIALGGGALTYPPTLETALARGWVICLTADQDRLAERIQVDSRQRPLLADDLTRKLSDLMAKRAPHYASFPIVIDTTHLTPLQSADECQIRMGCYRVTGMGADYSVRVYPGGIHRLADEMLQLGLKGPIALTSEDRVASYYLDRLLTSIRSRGFQASPVIFPAGEESKTIETVASLWQRYLKMGLERGSTVVALGGGVTTDLAGFAAATYQRGVAWVSAPTSLLGMIDAGIGGKTGIDLPEGKNLAGAFHAPALVWIDPGVLATLPEAEIRNGMAELLKHGIIADPVLFDLARKGFPTVPEELFALVSRASAVKVRYISEDPYERGVRASLNFGHTIGHGVEAASKYQLRHGEAVSIGMVLETRLAEIIGLAERGLSEQIGSALSGLGLPVRIPDELDRRAVMDAMRFDKKRADGKLKFALVQKIGETQVGITVSPDVVDEIIREGKE